jgi:cell division protein FtsQ
VSPAQAALRRIRSRPAKRSRSVPRIPALPPRLRRRMLALTVVALVFGGLYMFVLRDLGLVAVQKVQVTGLANSRDSARATAALQQAARKSTTLHVDHRALAAVTAEYPVIKSIAVHTNFPTGMRIDVLQQRPAALLLAGGRRIAVAGDGSILADVPHTGLPTVRVAGGSVPDKRLTPSGTLDAVRMAGGAPAALTPSLQSVTRQGDKGWVIQMHDGPDLIFGPATRIAFKWEAAARVLADRDAAGADYIDLRIPDRPAAGGLPVQTVQPVAPADGAAGDSQGQTVAPVAPATTTPQPTQSPDQTGPVAPTDAAQP